MNTGLMGDSAVGLTAINQGVRAPSAPQPALPLDYTALRTPGKSGRIQTLDAARLIAAVGVVFVHTVESDRLMPFGTIGTFAVPFYLFASLYFQARSFRKNPHRELPAYIWGRIKRLYVPFLAWTVLYLIARNLKHLALSSAPAVRPEFHHLWTGPAHHLWFLPFLVVVTIIVAALARASLGKPKVQWTMIVLSALIGAALAVAPRPDWLNFVQGEEGVFFLQSWKALPSAFLGMALAWGMAQAEDDELITPMMGVAGALLTATMLAHQIRYGYSRLERTLSGFGWLLAALATWRGPWVGWMARLGRDGYGIYLAHVLVVEGVQAAGHRCGLRVSVGFDVFVFLCGLLGALLVTRLLGKSKRLAWLNG